jgi:hypothetical protein
MRKHLARLAVGVGMAAVSAGVLTGGLVAPAQAAGGCSGAGPLRPGPKGGAPVKTTYCNAYRPGTVFGWRNQPPVGELNSGRSWFVCQWKANDNPAVGRARNNWWLWTQADVFNDGKPANGYGWFPATYISGGGNYQPIPGLAICDGSPR